jgi:hypothetical protein
MLLENERYPQDTRVRNEAESLVGAGHRVTVIAPRGPGQARVEVVDGVTVQRFRLRKAAGGVSDLLREYAVAHAQLFVRAARELLAGATVLHLHNPPDTLFPVGLLARVMRRRVVFDHHDLVPELFRQKFGRSRLELLLRAAELESSGGVLALNRRRVVVAAARRGVREGQERQQVTGVAGGREEDPHALLTESACAPFPTPSVANVSHRETFTSISAPAHPTRRRP